MDDEHATSKHTAEAITSVALIAFLIAAWPSIYAYLNQFLSPFIGPLSNYTGVAASIVKGIMSFLVVISIPLSVFFVIGIIYAIEGSKHIRKKEIEKYDLKVEPAFEDVPQTGSRDLSERWSKVTGMLASENQNDWKQAILQADTMLLDILTGLGYQGDGVGEKLKRVQAGEIKSIDDAWEAHKLRNEIAHEGTDFQLTHHDANQAIQRFRRVFEEFYYV